MKRMLCLILAIAFLIPMNALAADRDGFMPYAADMDAVARGTSELGPPIDRTVSVAVPVTYRQVIDGVVMSEYTVYETVATIVYRYRVSINSLGKYTGGVIVASQGWPDVDAIPSALLNPVVEVNSLPTGYVMPINNGDGYEVRIYSGSIDITYNDVIDRDIMNVTEPAHRKTVLRVFSFSETGP